MHFNLLVAVALTCSPLFADNDSNRQLGRIDRLVRRYMITSQFDNHDLWLNLMKLQPQGPAFVELTLSAILQNKRKWRPYNEPRAPLLQLIVTSTKASRPWTDFENSEARRTIHSQGQQLLQLFSSVDPISTKRRNLVIELFNDLKLWDESDLPFLRMCADFVTYKEK